MFRRKWYNFGDGFPLNWSSSPRPDRAVARRHPNCRATSFGGALSFQIHTGEALEVLRTLPSESVHCCVTSPPYWGLRDYGMKSQLGLERTPEEFVARLVGILNEARRVLRDDGTLWLNLGDSYAATGGPEPQQSKWQIAGASDTQNGKKSRRVAAGLKPKDLVGIPWRVAFALQADGWYLRSDIIWAKPAPMPESVTDRPTRSHEYIFLLAKSEKYYYNHEAIKEPSVCDHPSGNGYKREARLSFSDSNGARGSDESWKPRSARDSFKREGSKRAAVFPGQTVGTHRPDRAESEWDITTRNKRDVWTVNTKPFLEAHFATFPEDLIRPCIFAGCPEGGTVLDPFAGACTTGLVARKWNRNSVLIELNPEYCEMGRSRLNGFMSLFMDDQPAISEEASRG